MKKTSKKPVPSSASKPEPLKPVVVTIGSNDDDYYGDGIAVIATLVGAKPKIKGGFIDRSIGSSLWKCNIDSEESCCGFPVLTYFSNTKAASERAKDIGIAFAKELKDKMVYVSAYVPDTKEYQPTKNILEAAGFKRGVKLGSNSGNYTNTRWEWFSPTNPEADEKAICTIPV